MINTYNNNNNHNNNHNKNHNKKHTESLQGCEMDRKSIDLNNNSMTSCEESTKNECQSTESNNDLNDNNNKSISSKNLITDLLSSKTNSIIDNTSPNSTTMATNLLDYNTSSPVTTIEAVTVTTQSMSTNSLANMDQSPNESSMLDDSHLIESNDTVDELNFDDSSLNDNSLSNVTECFNIKSETDDLINETESEMPSTSESNDSVQSNTTIIDGHQMTNGHGHLMSNNLSDESISYLSDQLNNNQNTLINSNNITNNLLVTPTEQPSHYTYLKEFRVEQCQLFVQHKCTQHKPFTCFHWHFQNQRRRRPLRKKDGTFNYSPDNYCTKYDETTGICPDGDDCPLLHRTAGDTERRYHLRYYKTGICVYDTDNRGFCAKNGAHCAFAHGQNDLRNPLYDIHEMTHNSNLDDQENNNMMNGYSTSLDKDRNALEDPRWQDTAFVLSNYKTELCKKPPRLCRQGYACPQFHNSKDKRRTPKLFKYRSTPCPSVKQEEWQDPNHCEAGDSCHYCHTRTEQQFHPEIYKSTKCNDIQTTSFCPRGPFCAFAHNDQEMNADRELSVETTSDLVHMLSNAFGNVSSGALDKSSTLNASTNSNNSTNGISNMVNQFNSNQQFQSSNSININNQQQNNGNLMPSSVPTHFSFSELAASVGLRSQPTSGMGIRLENSPPMLGTHNHNNNNLGPIARPRSYSSSHTSNLHHNLSSITREQFMNSYFKNSIEEKAAVNGLAQQPNVLPTRKVSTPSALFTTGPNAQQFNALQSNMVNTSSHNNHLASSIQCSTSNPFFQNSDATNSTVGSVVHSLACLDDLSLDDVEESIEKGLVNSIMHDEQRNLQQNNPANLVRSTSNLIGNNINNNSGTAPMNIPGANQRADIGNISSPLIGFGQSPLSASLNHNVSSSVGSSLYDFASHSNMSPTNQQQQHLNLIQQHQQQNQQAILMNEIHRLRDELAMTKNKKVKFEEEPELTKKACEFWKNEAEKAKIVKEDIERRNL